MNQIIRREADMRRAPAAGITAGNIRSYLARRDEAYRYAEDELAKLDTTDVDRLAVSVAEDVQGWYQSGLTVTSQARSLMTSSADERRGLGGQLYQQGEKAHGTSVEDVNQRAEQARRALERKYGLSFPELE